MQDKRKIPVIVNEKLVIKCLNFHFLRGGASLVIPLGNRRMNRSACLEHFSSSIVKVSLKNSMSLGFVILEKLFTQTWLITPPSDDIKI